ncbi:hypothetical protein DFP73DRAFT_562699 [Morchella snyderi]|nr:hypothetical protein DFP73DRAFT_562699 [Morchella snyderi]
MPVLSTLTNPGTWHILAFGTLFGAEFYQTFISGVVAYRALPRPMFSQLQQKALPVFFTLQSILPVALLATHPTASAVSLLSTSSPYFYNTTIPIMVTLSSSLMNLFIVGPATTKIMKERRIQETKEGKKYYDEGPKSEAMQKLNSRFGKVHGISSMLALVGLLATGAYGGFLGTSLRL